jgi:hypothetical protein
LAENPAFVENNQKFFGGEVSNKGCYFNIGISILVLRNFIKSPQYPRQTQ